MRVEVRVRMRMRVRVRVRVKVKMKVRMRLKAGAAYVPLDGSIVTQSTLDFVLENSQAAVVLTLSQFTHRVAGRPVIALEDAIAALDGPQQKPEDLSSPDDCIYIIYTSGQHLSSVHLQNANSLTFRHHRYSQGRSSHSWQCDKLYVAQFCA